ncbi:MAG: hypothetical protein SGI73_09065 [Chloroflexota bacterium]|nr:hypothetical protein [Chloroflexota bacterium]
MGGEVALILLIAFLVRLIVAFDADPLAAYTVGGGDSAWYLANGYALITGMQPPTMLTDVSRLASPPLYFIVIGVPQALLSPASAVMAIWVLHAIMGALTCAFAARIAYRLTANRRALVLTVWALALHPALIIEAGQILTETTFTFLLVGGMWALLREGSPKMERGRGGEVLAAVLFGLATLTRAVLIPFPLLLIAFAVVLRVTTGRRAVAFALVYAAVVGSWTLYSGARWGRWVIAGEGLPAFLYLGAAGWDDPTAVDAQLLASGGATTTDDGDIERDFGGAAGATIAADPLGYLTRRASELASAYLQPHGTTALPGRSLRDLFVDWVREDRTVDGLIALTRGDSFWIKLALYMVHYGGLIFGAIGLLRGLRRRATRRLTLMVAAPILYFTAVHSVLYVLPRYLFPIMLFGWIFACTSWVSNRRATKLPPPSSLMGAPSRPT